MSVDTRHGAISVPLQLAAAAVWAAGLLACVPQASANEPGALAPGAQVRVTAAAERAPTVGELLATSEGTNTRADERRAPLGRHRNDVTRTAGPFALSDPAPPSPHLIDEPRDVGPDKGVPDSARGHRAIWDHLVVAGALGAIAGRARGCCEGKTFVAAPVATHVGFWSLISPLIMVDVGNPYVTRHQPGEVADRRWDMALIGAGLGAAYGLISSYSCGTDDRIQRGRMAATGAAVLGMTGLALDILHKHGQPRSATVGGLRISPVLRSSGVGFSISKAFEARSH